MEKIMPLFGERLRELRKEKGLKQTEMAAFLSFTEAHYQRMEYGTVNIPSLTLEKLADFFEVSTDYLLGRDDRRKP